MKYIHNDERAFLVLNKNKDEYKLLEIAHYNKLIGWKYEIKGVEFTYFVGEPANFKVDAAELRIAIGGVYDNLSYLNAEVKRLTAVPETKEKITVAEFVKRLNADANDWDNMVYEAEPIPDTKILPQHIWGHTFDDDGLTWIGYYGENADYTMIRGKNILDRLQFIVDSMRGQWSDGWTENYDGIVYVNVDESSVTFWHDI
jgi:hypothetical protein